MKLTNGAPTPMDQLEVPYWYDIYWVDLILSHEKAHSHIQNIYFRSAQVLTQLEEPQWWDIYWVGITLHNESTDILTNYLASTHVLVDQLE